MSSQIVNLGLSLLAALVSAPALVLTLECLAALLPRRRETRALGVQRARVGVLIPAHNEERVIGRTLEAVKPHLKGQDRLLVVADNCDDNTASVARAVGAEVAERRDPDRRGKGYALDHGVRCLEADAPEVLIMIDADCEVESGSIDALCEQVAATRRPAQAVYLMEAPERASPRDTVSAFAFLVKNLVRPAGLRRMGAPCLLTGTGMAFTWSDIKSINLAGGNIVEDMQMGLDLAVSGHAPMLCESARVTGRLPQQDQAAVGQRTRWEHGHLRTLATQAPRLLLTGTKRLNPGLLALACELSVPPLSLLVMALVAALGVCVIAGALGASWAPAQTLLGVMLLLAAALLGAWAKFARTAIPLSALLAAPAYVAWKIPLYIAFVFRPQKAWVRTHRDEPVAPSAPRGGGVSP